MSELPEIVSYLDALERRIEGLRRLGKRTVEKLEAHGASPMIGSGS